MKKKISLEKVFYLSQDKKYYCFYFYIDLDISGSYFFGILDKENGNYLVMTYILGSFYVKNYFFDLDKCESLNCIQDADIFDYPPISLSEETLEILSHKSKPLEIIDALENYFCTMYEELYGN
ncbi:hypothetical protein [Moumouvirus maliensis]|nr:hypothetical protein [Moumouvirus maliensis]